MLQPNYSVNTAPTSEKVWAVSTQFLGIGKNVCTRPEAALDPKCNSSSCKSSLNWRCIMKDELEICTVHTVSVLRLGNESEEVNKITFVLLSSLIY